MPQLSPRRCTFPCFDAGLDLTGNNVSKVKSPHHHHHHHPHHHHHRRRRRRHHHHHHHRPSPRQICYNLLFRGAEFEVIPFCLEHGIRIIVYSPLQQALLTGRWKSADEVPVYRTCVGLGESCVVATAHQHHKLHSNIIVNGIARTG